MTSPPMNDLEDLLEKIYVGDDLQQVFLETLENASLYTLGFFIERRDPTPPKKITGLREGDSVQFVFHQDEQVATDDEEGAITIPCFSSIRLLEQAAPVLHEHFDADPEDYPYILTTGAELFHTTRGASLVLNPGQAPYEVVFSPEEIARLLGDIDSDTEHYEALPYGDFVLREPAFPSKAMETPLETDLRHAVDNPAQRPAFYHALLATTGYVLIDNADVAESLPGDDVPIDDTTQVIGWPRDKGLMEYPVFTSPAMVQASIDALVEHELIPVGATFGYMEVQLAAFFDAVQSHVVHINPLIGYSRLFYPHEIQHLLAHGLPSPPGEQMSLAKDDVTLSAISDPPADLVDVLTQLFAQHDSVHRAYLAMASAPSLGTAPRCLVCVDVQEDCDPALFETAAHVADISAPDTIKPVLFTALHHTTMGALERFIADGAAAFYERKWAAHRHHSPGNA